MIAHASRTCVFLGAALVLPPVPRATARGVGERTPKPWRGGVSRGAALVLPRVPRATAPASTPHPPPPFRHVFILVEENKNYASVIGNPAMPYLNRLADQYGLATQYYANTHPSIGNYFMLTVGDTVTKNDEFSAVVNGDNIVRERLAAVTTL